MSHTKIKLPVYESMHIIAHNHQERMYSMALAQTKVYTEEDYYNLPEDVRAELIDGQLIYNQAAPSTTHQIILSELHTTINNYIKSKAGSCRVFPAPFAVELPKNRKTIVEPDVSVICDGSKLTDKGCTGAPDWIIDPHTEKVLVYYFGQVDLQMETYTFQDKIKANIYDDLFINFSDIAASLNI